MKYDAKNCCDHFLFPLRMKFVRSLLPLDSTRLTLWTRRDQRNSTRSRTFGSPTNGAAADWVKRT
jgi:hypothetical protein